MRFANSSPCSTASSSASCVCGALGCRNAGIAILPDRSNTVPASAWDLIYELLGEVAAPERLRSLVI